MLCAFGKVDSLARTLSLASVSIALSMSHDACSFPLSLSLAVLIAGDLSLKQTSIVIFQINLLLPVVCVLSFADAVHTRALSLTVKFYLCTWST